ncbi:hypothetical protein ACVIJ6_005126 [Bradyrhizobium sp. USDA 4369]
MLTLADIDSESMIADRRSRITSRIASASFAYRNDRHSKFLPIQKLRLKVKAALMYDGCVAGDKLRIVMPLIMRWYRGLIEAI